MVDHAPERRWALSALRQPHRYLQAREGVLVDAELVRVLELAEEGGRVVYEDRLDLRRQLALPSPWAEGDLIDELLRRALVIAVGDPRGDRLEAAGTRLQHRSTFGIMLEQAEQRRLVAGKGTEDVRVPRRQPQRDGPAEGVRDDMGGREIERRQESGEVVAIVVHGPRGLLPLAARVAAAVVGENAEGLGETRRHQSPTPRVDPGAMHHGQGLAVAVQLVVEPDAVRLRLGHVLSPRSRDRRV